MAGISRLGLFVALTLLSLNCAAPARNLIVPERPAPQKDPFAGEDGHVDLEKANAFVRKAEQALLENNFDAAEKYLIQAEPFGNDTTQEMLRGFRQKMAHIQAMRLAKPLANQLKAGKCMVVAQQMAATLGRGKRKMVGVLLRKELSAGLLDCLLGALQIDVSIGRELSESAVLRKALTKLHYQRLQAGVDDATATRVVTRLQKLIDQKRWQKVVATLDELVARKEAGSKEVRGVMKVVRTAIAKQIEGLVAGGLKMSFGVAGRLRQVDKLIRLGRFSSEQQLQAGLAEKVRAKRNTLALAVQCKNIGCKWVSPRKVFALGMPAIRPLLDVRGEPIAKAKHAMVLWLVATGKGFGLVAKEKPTAGGELEVLRQEAWGWVSSPRVLERDTREVLPPDAAIVGKPVWGALRQGQKLWELGRVVSLKGSRVQIQRASDHRMVERGRSSLVYGKTKVGMRVMADCGKLAVLQSSTLLQVSRPKQGEPVFSVRCEEGPQKGKTRRVLYGALRAEGKVIKQLP